METLKRVWYRYSSNKMSVVGLVIVVTVVTLAVFAPMVSPYPKHAGVFVDFANASKPPSWTHLLGTDTVGRDIFSRLLFCLRSTLMMSVIVLSIAAPVGFMVGVVAGYMKGTFVDSLLMRITDIFLSIPPLVLALAIASVLEPNLKNSMLAITVMWWPWYARLAYGIASSLRQENYIVYAELTGAKLPYIIFKEFLPNCVSPVLTKMTLDIGYVIIMGATLSFAGLGEQAPAPALGNMISEGVQYLPNMWWLTLFPAVTIVVIVLGFNLFGDGISNVFSLDGE